MAPDKIHGATDHSDPCGPALAAAGPQVFLAWKGKGNSHPNCESFVQRDDWGAKFISGGDGPRESNPAISIGNAMIYLSWVGPDNHIRLIQLRPTDPLSEVSLPPELHKLPATTGHNGTPALAFGKNQLFIAWSAADESHRLNLLRLDVSSNGEIPSQVMHARVLSDWTSDATGPALAFSALDNRLYLAFTGADDTLWVIPSTDGGTTFPNRTRLGNGSEKSRHDAGPAIAVHASGTVAVSWIGTDGS